MMHQVDVYELDALEISGDEDTCAPLVASMYRLQRQRCEQDRLEQLGLGMLMAHVLGVTDDGQVGISPWGKPHLASGQPPFFNVSHDAGLVVLAVADVPVGIDTQAIGVVDEPVARRFFSPDVHAALLAADDRERPAIFARHWTVLEACLKANGTGFDVDRGDIPNILAHWVTQTWCRPDGFMISCAAPGPFVPKRHLMGYRQGGLHERMAC